MSAIVTELQAKLEEFQSLSTINSHLEDVKQQLGDKYEGLKVITKQVQKEEKDLNDLENSKLKDLFYKVLGDKEKQMEKERQEYLAVSLKYNALKEEIELLEFEENVLKKKSINLPKIEQEIKQLKKQREHEIVNGPRSNLQAEYLVLMNDYQINVMLHKELEEAIIAGDNANKALYKLATLLNEAMNWGNWQRGSRGYSQMVKRNKLTNAYRLVADVQRRLDQFGREMSDLSQKNMYYKLNKQEFASFTDFFFDNLITDWIVQKRIKNSLSNVEMIRDKIVRSVESMKHEIVQVRNKRESLLSSKDQLLVQ